jgi:integrase/recombinase XerD
MQVEEACAAFIHHCTVRKLSPHTIRAYRLDLRRLATIVGQLAVEEFDRTLLHQYAETLFSRYDLSPASARRHLASAHALFRWLRSEGIIATDPFQQTSIRIKLPQRLPRVLTRGELGAVLTMQTSSLPDLIGRVAAEVLFATGMRVAELASLRDEDVDLPNDTITIRGKGDRQRRVYIPDHRMRDLLATYLRTRNRNHPAGGTFLINTRGGPASTDYIRRLIRRRAAQAHILRRITPHMFRHSLATYLLEEGVDIRFVQRLLGHRSITTTQIYTHVADATLKSIVQERHPRRRLWPEPQST